MVEQNARIKHISHLTTFPDAEQAECLLHKLAYMAAYIMQKYGFKLKRLAEFYPPSNHKGLLMGRNTRHEQIEIRLRSESDRTLFLPREVVMDTLIHELSHMKSMDHDQTFRNTYCELWKSYSAHVAYYPECFSFSWPSNQRRLAANHCQMQSAQEQVEVKRHQHQAHKGKQKDRPVLTHMQHLDISPRREPKEHRHRHHQHAREAEHRNRPERPQHIKEEHDKRNEIEHPKRRNLCPKCGLEHKGEIWYICDGCGCLSPYGIS